MPSGRLVPPMRHGVRYKAWAILGALLGSCLAILTSADQTCTAALPKFKNYTFKPDPVVTLSFEASSASKTLSGRVITQCQEEPNFSEEEVVGDIALVVTNAGQGCWTNPSYSHGDFDVVQGTSVGGNFSFPSYKVSPPSSRAEKFAASGQHLYLKVAPGNELVLYELADGLAVKRATVSAPDNADAATFVDSGVAVHQKPGDVIYMVAAADDATPGITKRVARAAVATVCKDSVPEAATVGDLAIVTTSYSNSCWTDGRYNSDEVLVEQGVLFGDDGSTMVAYRVSPPAKAPTEFLGSKMGIQFRASDSVDFVLRTYNGQSFVQRASFSAEAGNFVETGISADDLSDSTIFVFSKAGVRLSVWPLQGDVEVATLAMSDDHILSARRFPVGGRPFVPESDWAYGPGQHTGNYGTPKKFIPVDRADGWEGVVWEDQADRCALVTWLSPDLLTHKTLKLLDGGSHRLLTACSDGDSQLILLLASSITPADKTAPTELWARRFNSTTGEELASMSLPTQKSGGLNMHSFFSSGASMSWNPATGMVGVVLSRTMTQAGDGLNHQGATSFVLDASSLNMVKLLGQTTSHSFSNTLMVDESGAFLGMDLGDNYPRGVHVWRFDNETRKGRVVYQFKTLHGRSPKSPAGATYPEFTEISTEETTFYKWSNDNYVYTELAHPGIVEVSDGLLVFFSGETPSLDNSKTGTVMNSPRNAALVKVPKDLSSAEVLSQGPVESGGFYSFGGGWSEQQNKGVTQLTSYEGMEQSVSRMKTARISANETLLWWELWSASQYFETQFMLVDNAGNITTPVTKINFPARVAIQDDIRVVGSKVVAYAGTAEGRLARFELCLDPEPLLSDDGDDDDKITPPDNGDVENTTNVTTSRSAGKDDDDDDQNVTTSRSASKDDESGNDVSSACKLIGFSLATAAAAATAFLA